MYTKKGLAILLSQLRVYDEPDVKLEQYPTEPEIAADICWKAYQLGDITNKTVSDFGCGTGIISIAAFLLGADKVIGIDVDEKSIKIARRNLSKVSNKNTKTVKFIKSDIKKIRTKTDVVIQNPPFGTRAVHSDRDFLIKAFQCADVVYSLHKASTIDFILKLAKSHSTTITHKWNYDFPLKATMRQHRRNIHRIKVVCVRCEKSKAF